MKEKGLIIAFVVLISLGLLQGCNNGSKDDLMAKEESSINKTESIKIGGINQWINIKGDDLKKPILLVLHGGPGFSMMPLLGEVNSELEREFIIVNWDQRGSGKTYNHDIPIKSMSLEQFVLDANELTEYLKERFNKEKIFVLGHSFGSLIGVKLIEEYPSNYYGYFGTGQVIDFINNEQLGYDFVLKKAVDSNHYDVVNILKSIGRPDSKGNYLLESGYEETSKYIEYYGGDLYGERSIDPIYEIIFDSDIYKDDEQNLLNGYKFSQLLFNDENVRSINLLNDIKQVDVPVYFLIGRHDYDTPAKLVEEYYDVIEAPHKEIIWFEESAHFPFYEEPKKFNEILINRVKLMHL